jgi:hypothetical protein
LLTAADLDQEYTGRNPPKRPEDRTLLGRTLLPRPDLEDKVLGRPRFVQDLRLPGMLHGRVLRAPLLDAPLADAASDVLQDLQAQMPQVKAWADGRFVAVVAERERDADAAAQRLRLPLLKRRGHGSLNVLSPALNPGWLNEREPWQPVLRQAPTRTAAGPRGRQVMPRHHRRCGRRTIKWQGYPPLNDRCLPLRQRASRGVNAAAVRWLHAYRVRFRAQTCRLAHPGAVANPGPQRPAGTRSGP